MYHKTFQFGGSALNVIKFLNYLRFIVSSGAVGGSYVLFPGIGNVLLNWAASQTPPAIRKRNVNFPNRLPEKCPQVTAKGRVQKNSSIERTCSSEI